MSEPSPTWKDTDIAIVGMAGRFPGAADADQLWRNVRDGVESILAHDDAALRERGVSAAELRDPQFVRADAALPDVDRFDAGFFGYSPREAEDMDPQHRLFLETSWQALENAGYDAPAWPRPIGVYAGVGVNTYLLLHLVPSGRFANLRDISALQGLMNGNNKDSMSTSVAYKLNLRGPAVTVQTACSTSLAAVHVACRGLLNHECDMALAGGAWINLLHKGGYPHQAGAILSSDGHCRAFDAGADGTVIGSGVGVVVLKRVADAVADADTIYALIKGSALNNDGAAKVGYTAPSVAGQAEVIAAAQAMAEVPARTVTYVEAHGTGTVMGDPIEIAALTRAFRVGTEERGFCAVGSVKTNVGHLDAAAGIVGLIKTVQALRHQTLPPSLHFKTPNPQIDFAASPFYVNTVARTWPEGPTPRRAGVSSFGIGGTNVHVVLEEVPAQEPLPASGRWQFLPLSARTPNALEAALDNLRAHVREHPEQAIDDIAHTLQIGRARFAHRAVAVVRDRDDALQLLSTREAQRFCLGRAAAAPPSVAFLFPGQGAQHVDMGRALYATEPVFRAEFDRCAEELKPALDLDLRTVVYPNESTPTATARLSETALTQPALFTVSYALARLWMSWGIQPRAMLGHSVGEYVAACLSGVFSLSDALQLVAARAQLLQALPRGAMLAVSLPEAALSQYAGRCDIAAVNGPRQCVLSGALEQIEAVERDLASQGAAVQRLRVSHAFHSALVEPACAALAERVARIRRQAPSIPFLSNVTGTWITAPEVMDPHYWARHLRGTVRFAEGLTQLLAEPGRALIEVGPGDALTQLSRRHPAAANAAVIVSSQPQAREQATALDHLAVSLGRVWIAGVEMQWEQLRQGERRRRVPLPTYPFEKHSYWVAAEQRVPGTVLSGASSFIRELDDWFYAPSWRRAEVRCAPQAAPGCTLIFGDDSRFTTDVIRSLQSHGSGRLVLVERGPAYACVARDRYCVRPGESSDLRQLLVDVREASEPATQVLHLWTVPEVLSAAGFADRQVRGFFTLTALVNALDAVQPDVHVAIEVVTCGLADITGEEILDPAQALLIGPCRVIPQEHPQLSCRVLDIDASRSPDVIDALVRDLRSADRQGVVAYRGRYRWEQHFAPLRLPEPSCSPWRKQGVYLITGGFGGIGLALADHLARTSQARLVLVGRNVGDAAEQAVRRLQELGAEVCVLAADLAQPQDVHAMLDRARKRFGVVHGVFHAAGVAGGGLVCDTTAQRTEHVFGAKIQGTQTLLHALADEALDFVLLFSSLATIAGGLRKVDYCAANAFLDVAAIAAARRSRFPIVAVNWDSWREVGMAAQMEMPDGVGIGPGDGIAACERILAGATPAQVIVSTLDLQARLASTRGDLLSQPLLVEAVERTAGHARPALASRFEPPLGELEVALAAIWRGMLGIEQIGRDDNFFELGGDSLLGIQVLSRVRAKYSVNLQPAPFFKRPTVAGLAELVETRLLDEIERGAAVSLVE